MSSENALTARPVLDESRLIEEFGGDVEILSELRDLFVMHVPPLLDEIKAAFVGGDGEAAAKAAHSLKGAASTYGAERLSEAGRQVEMAAREGRLAEAEERIGALEGEMQAAFEQIDQLMQKL